MNRRLRYGWRRAGLWIWLTLGARARAEAWLDQTLVEFPADAHALVSRAHLLAV